MTLIPIDYSKCIIYKIVCKDLNITECYVGHTTNFVRRKREHKSRCNTKTSKHYNQKKYQFIRNNGGWENWEMIQIEEYCCKNSNEAIARERYWVEKFGSLNDIIPTRTIQEWRDDNKEYIKEKSRNNYINSKEDIICECGSEILKHNLDRHRNSIKHQNYLKTL